MARSFVIVVSDDFTTLQKVRSFAHEQGIDVKAYSTNQWDEGLENTNFRMQVHTEGYKLVPGQNSDEGGKVLPFPANGQQNNQGNKRVATMDEIESVAIKNAIFEFKGNLTEAAKALGIGRATLYRKVKQYNIDPSEARNRAPKAA